MGALAAETAAPLPAAANDAAPASRSLLRFITCGSVDDGKSTLLGRLLYEAGAIPDDVIATLEADSARIGRADRGLDYSLLLDGLQAEREQGITIDVAYRYFSTTRAPSSSPTRRVTSSTPATWRPAPRPPISRSS